MSTLQQALLASFAIGIAVTVVLSERHPRARVRRRRLGVDTSARLGRGRDLKSLIVSRHHPPGDRVALGYRGRHLIAAPGTRYPARRRGWRKASGDRSSVAIIGPTRCGKTATTIAAVLDWTGPAILSSVKSDLLAATIGWRRSLGDVRVFDPTQATGNANATWSPLRGAHTIRGAQQAARALVDAGPRTGADNLDFFLRLAEQLLWPHLRAAAAAGYSMRDVVRWVHTQTSPVDPDTDLGDLVFTLDSDDGDATREALAATWNLDRRTRASAYATVQTLLGAWTDPVIAQAADDDIDLNWLLAGANTLYLCAPLHHQARLAPVFGGLLGDLFNQAYETFSATNTPLPATLVVLDEAANTPTAWLPQVASTCAGIGIQLVTVWQAKAQLDAAYGRLAESVLTNHGTKLVFSGASDLTTLDYVRRLLGDEEVERRTVGSDSTKHRSFSSGTHDAPLTPAHVIRQAAPGQALLISGALPAAQLRARPYYLDRRLSRRSTTVDASR